MGSPAQGLEIGYRDGHFIQEGVGNINKFIIRSKTNLAYKNT
jgi:hypothetical protein